MKRQEFELDVYNRQRNIVFPDTVLNEGRFYRNMFSREAEFTRGQRIALVVYGLCLMVPASVQTAGSIVAFHQQPSGVAAYAVLGLLFGLAFFTLSVALVIRGIFPPKVTRLMRLRRYRRWPRG